MYIVGIERRLRERYQQIRDYIQMLESDIGKYNIAYAFLSGSSSLSCHNCRHVIVTDHHFCFILILILLSPFSLPLPSPPPPPPPQGLPQQQYDAEMSQLEKKLSDYRSIIDQQEKMLQHQQATESEQRSSSPLLVSHIMPNWKITSSPRNNTMDTVIVHVLKWLWWLKKFIEICSFLCCH